MAKRKYKFTRKIQSGKGIASTIIGILTLLITFGMVAAAYIQSGQAGKIIAVAGFAAMLLSVLGLYYSICGIRQEDSYRMFPWMGFVLNWLTLAAYIMIYILGW